jgi:hypothetical protein
MELDTAVWTTYLVYGLCNPCVLTWFGREPWVVRVGGMTHYRGLGGTARNGTRQYINIDWINVCCVVYVGVGPRTGLKIASCLAMICR